ncbi:MAG: hypothetical protein AAF683_13460 [Pseudomonadota bacterium]
MVKLFLPGLAAAEQERKEQTARKSSSERNRGRSMRALLAIFPLLAVPVIIYNLMSLAVGPEAEYFSVDGNTVAPLLAQLDNVMVTIEMIGGVIWEVTAGDLLIVLSIGFLFLEILKSTSTGTATIINHAVSMMLFIVCLVEFLLFADFATSTFFIIMVMTLLDVLAGVVVTIIAARRDFAVGEGIG